MIGFNVCFYLESLASLEKFLSSIKKDAFTKLEEIFLITGRYFFIKFEY